MLFGKRKRARQQRNRAKQQIEMARAYAENEESLTGEKTGVTVVYDKPAGEVVVNTLSDIIRYVCMIVIFAGFLIGVMAVIVPESREVLVGVWKDTLDNVTSLIIG